MKKLIEETIRMIEQNEDLKHFTVENITNKDIFRMMVNEGLSNGESYKYIEYLHENITEEINSYTFIIKEETISL